MNVPLIRTHETVSPLYNCQWNTFLFLGPESNETMKEKLRLRVLPLSITQENGHGTSTK